MCMCMYVEKGEETVTVNVNVTTNTQRIFLICVMVIRPFAYPPHSDCLDMHYLQLVNGLKLKNVNFKHAESFRILLEIIT